MTSHINVVSRSPSYDNSDEPPLRRLSTTEILYDIEQRNNANQENIINEILLNIETNLNNDEKIQLIRRLETTILSQPIGLLSSLYIKVTCDFESGSIPGTFPNFLSFANNSKILFPFSFTTIAIF